MFKVSYQVVLRRSQVQTPTLCNPPTLPTPTCFSSFLLNRKTSKIFQLSLLSLYSSSLSCNMPETSFFTIDISTLMSLTSMDFIALGISIFSVFPPSFFEHAAYLIAFCSLEVSIFTLCCFRPENAYIPVTFPMWDCSERRLSLLNGVQCQDFFTESIEEWMCHESKQNNDT